jgi:hypothetical protein
MPPASPSGATLAALGQDADAQSLNVSALVRVNLRRTIPIAVIVGLVLTAINHGDAIVHGTATSLTAIKSGLNFCVPFVVSNLGVVLSHRRD